MLHGDLKTAVFINEQQIEITHLSSVAPNTSLSVREVRGSIAGRSNRTYQRLAASAMFIRSCVVQALSRGGGPHHSPHASVHYRENAKDLTFFSNQYLQ